MAGYVIKVTLENTHPPVWRRIVIPEKISFENLHRILQAAFQWEEEHMHDFSFPETESRVAMKGEIYEGDVTEEHVLVDGMLTTCKYIRYTYDFGDDWKHKIVFEKEDPDYNARHATVIKYKGDSFEEDSGGVWGNEDEDNRISFNMEEVNKKLGSMDFPARKEGRKSKELLEEVSAERVYGELYKRLRKTMKEAVAANLLEEQESEIARKVSRWVFLYRTGMEPRSIHVMKNISRKSGVELFCQYDQKGAREQCKYIGAETESTDTVTQCAVKFWDRLGKHPEYLAYIFIWDELKELIDLVQAPNSECSRIPDMYMIEKALAFGLFDMSEETVNQNRYVVLRQLSEVEELIRRYTQKEWEHISKAYGKRIDNCNHLLNMYSMMELEVFCEKYKECFKDSADKNEILRAVYLRGTFCRELQTAETADGKAYIAQSYIDMNRVLQEQINENVATEYRIFSAKEKKRFLEGYGSMYSAWAEGYDYLMESYDLDEDEVEEYLFQDYSSVRNGDGAEVLLEDVNRAFTLDSIECYISFWQYCFGVCLTTGLPKYKGYSREEYAAIKGISPVELGICGDITPVKRITKKTHIYKMPPELQLRIYKIMEDQSDRKKIEGLEALLKELGVRNYELVYMLCASLIFEEENERAEEYLKELRKAYPKDKGVELLQDMIGYRIYFDDEEPSMWDIINEEPPKSNIVTFHREQPKIGRNDPCPCGSGKKYKKCCGKGK